MAAGGGDLKSGGACECAVRRSGNSCLTVTVRRSIEGIPDSKECCGVGRSIEVGRWCHVRLESANPRIDLPGSLTKSCKPEQVPLLPDVADALARHRGEAKERNALFAEIPSMEVFRSDLAKAKIPEEDERGRKVVVHSLRHSLATMLAQSKVPPAVPMKMMRHRDIRLTLEAYTDDSLLMTGRRWGRCRGWARQPPP